MEVLAKQYCLSVAAGKRLIAKAVTELPQIKRALKGYTIVIVAGTTNAYVAEELLKQLHQESEFDRQCFFRGITLPPHQKRPSGEKFLGDVVIIDGQWHKGLTLYDVVDQLKEGDIIVKGANAVNLQDQEAAVLIEHTRAGTMGVGIQAVIGRRVELLIPVGLEKRITDRISSIAAQVNAPGTTGLRYFPIKGTIITELEAIQLLSGCNAQLIAAGGVSQAEGSSWLLVSGTQQQLSCIDQIMAEVKHEPPFVL